MNQPEYEHLSMPDPAGTTRLDIIAAKLGGTPVPPTGADQHIRIAVAEVAARYDAMIAHLLATTLADIHRTRTICPDRALVEPGWPT